MNSILSSINNESVRRLTSGLLLSPKTVKTVIWILLLFIIYLLSVFSWALWDYFQPRQALNVKPVANSAIVKQNSKVNINQLTRYNLFGDTRSTTKITDNNALDAPVTRLLLKLRGVYAASEDILAGAMIEASGKQDVYRVGSKLPGAAGLKLHKILSDRVIMSRGGKFETLLIEDFGKAGTSVIRKTSQQRTTNTMMPVTTNAKNIIDRRKDTNLSRDLNKLRAKLTDPQSLKTLVSVSPAMNGDQFQGFRLAPGKNRALFGRMGLRRNDIVTEINGIRLDDPASAFSLMEQIRTASEINMSVKRGDRTMNILFSADK